MVQRTQGCPPPMFAGSLTLWHAKVNCLTVLALLAGHVTSPAGPDLPFLTSCVDSPALTTKTAVSCQ